MNRRGFLQAALGLGAGLVVGDDPERAGWVKGERVYSFARPIVQGIPDGFLAALKAFTAEHGSPLETSLNDALFPRLIYKEPVIGHIEGVSIISAGAPARKAISRYGGGLLDRDFKPFYEELRRT